MEMTQHQMKCIGLGLHPDSPLDYMVEVQNPALICTTKITLTATSESILRHHIAVVYPEAHIESIRIM